MNQFNTTVPLTVTQAPAEPVAIEFYNAQTYVPQDSVGYLLRTVLTLVAHEIDAQLEACDLTNAQWLPLLKLYLGQASTVAEVARVCQLDAGAMTRLLDRLEAKGLVRRVRSVSDRRVVNIELTDAGMVVAKGIPVVLSRVQNEHLKGFSIDEFETLKGFLRRIISNAQGPLSNPTTPIAGGPNAA
jgi:DNA-binding MarR family transcriptional regulator